MLYYELLYYIILYYIIIRQDHHRVQPVDERLQARTPGRAPATPVVLYYIINLTCSATLCYALLCYTVMYCAMI